MQKKVKAKVREIAPRGQTENTTRDLRSYRVELFLLTCISVHQMKFLLRVRVLRDILMRSTLVLGGRSSHLLVLRARSMVGLAPRRLGSGSKGGDKKKSNLNGLRAICIWTTRLSGRIDTDPVIWMSLQCASSSTDVVFCVMSTPRSRNPLYPHSQTAAHIWPPFFAFRPPAPSRPFPV